MRAYQQFSCQWSTVDCEVDQWGEWGDCSVTCGDGFKNRSRDVLQQSSGSVSYHFLLSITKKQWIKNKQQVEGGFATAQWKWSFLSKYLGNRPLQSWKLYRFFSVLYLFWVLGSVLLNVNTSSDVQILNFIHLILLWFRILGRSMRQGQEATSVGEIPRQVEREHT